MIFLVLLFISFCIQRIIDEVFEPSSMTLELLLDSSFRKNPNINRLSLSDSIKLRYFENIDIDFEQIQQQAANASMDDPNEKLIKSSIMMNSRHYVYMEPKIEDFIYLMNVYDYPKNDRRHMVFHDSRSCKL